jgi:hypothetical protein
MCISKGFVTAPLRGLIIGTLLIGTMLSLGAIIVRSVEATEGGGSILGAAPADLRGSVR